MNILKVLRILAHGGIKPVVSLFHDNQSRRIKRFKNTKVALGPHQRGLWYYLLLLFCFPINGDCYRDPKHREQEILECPTTKVQGALWKTGWPVSKQDTHCRIVSSKHERDATHMNVWQYSCLNKTCMVTTPVDKVSPADEEL